MADKAPEVTPAALIEALAALGDVLHNRGLAYEIVVIGGAGLALLGLVVRPTRDVDVLALREGDRVVPARSLPGALAEAARDVARTLGLSDDWLNPGPASLVDLGLPAGFQARLTTRAFGGLVVHVASREDQIAFKLYAAVDQGPRSKHFADLRALAPTSEELVAAGGWSRTHDPSPGFARELAALLRAMGIERDDV